MGLVLLGLVPDLGPWRSCIEGVLLFSCSLIRGVVSHPALGILSCPPPCSCPILLQVPLEAASVDAVVFCLALMGTNLCEILEEANRVLRVG